MKIKKKFLWINVLIVAVIYTQFVSSEGNITTSSGNINLIPAGSRVDLVSGKILRISSTGGSNTFDIFHNGTDTFFNSSSGFTHFQSNDKGVRFYTNGAAQYYMTDNNFLRFLMSPMVEDSFSQFYHWPNRNSSNEIKLMFGVDNGERGGLLLEADQEHDKQFVPVTNDQYNLGYASKCWSTIYAYNFYDCGSPTKMFNSGDDALAAIRQYSKATLSSTDKEYYQLIPTEFQVDGVGCGHNLTNTDEVINALVLSVSKLSDRVSYLEKQLVECNKRQDA